MRKLSATKAVSHAFSLIWAYRAVAMRIVLVWVPVMLGLAVVELLAGPADPTVPLSPVQMLLQFATGLVSFIAACSVAVSWHRFVLRDEAPGSLRLDVNVLRYGGSTIVIMVIMLIPAVLVLAGADLMPSAAAIAGLASLILVGGAITRLSVKLPAVALGNQAFGFRDAWGASDGNFWPCVGIFMLNLLIAFGCVFPLLIVSGLLSQTDAMLGDAVLILGAAVMQLFYAIFNASMLTSLYGYFVERRDF